MAINDIVQTVADARVDARSLSDFVFKPAGFKVPRRLAPPIDTLQFYIDRFDATKAATDAYVATIPTIVNDAINNTAVEGGVLADTFVTATANGVGAVARNQRAKNKDVVSVKDYGAVGNNTSIPVSTWTVIGSTNYFPDLAAIQVVYPHVTALTDTVDWAATQQAVNKNSHVIMPTGRYDFGDKTLKLNGSLISFTGQGSQTLIKSSAMTALAWNGKDRVLNSFVGHFNMNGVKTVGSKGFDMSGFSYGTVVNLQIRFFDDGVFADGTTFGIPHIQQFSNNTFINVRSNNHIGHGWKFVGASESNSANTFVGCEGSGNKHGFYEDTAYCTRVLGCCFQGNAITDFYSNGTNGDYDFYAEGLARSVKLGVNSRNLRVTCRSAFPLWNTFDDKGTNNIVSVRGERGVERHLFHNPHWLNIGSNGVPEGLVKYGTTVLTVDAEPTSINNKALKITFDGVSSTQGLYLKPKLNADMRGQWVTIIMEMDTSAVTNTPAIDIRTRHENSDGSANGANGELVNTVLEKTTGFKTFIFDVRFSDLPLTAPDIRILFFGTPVGTIKIRSMYILEGQTAQCSFYVGAKSEGSNITATTALLSASSEINTFNKVGGKMVYAANTGKMYFAVGNAPTSPWRATDASGDLTPV